jgi:predicted Zn-dependent protease
VLALSRADACIVIGRRQATANVRWANNTVTTNGVAEDVSLSVIAIIGRRVASVTRTYFPADRLEEMVREAEAACRRNPEAADYVPLAGGAGAIAARDWAAPAADTDIHVFDTFAPALGAMFDGARRSAIQTFGYGEHQASTTWLATSTGIRLRHDDRLGKVEVTAKSRDFSRSSWAGTATSDFADVRPVEMLARLAERLRWSERRIELPAGPYEVLLEPSCTADLAIAAYGFMARREADEGRSPFSRAGGGTRIGESLFGSVSIASDPSEPDIETAPFHVGVESSDATSVFDNGVPLGRTEWVRDGVLRALVTPRYWAARESGEVVPYVDNLVVAGAGATVDAMIASTRRALLVTCLWYIRPVDPQTALLTGLTRDGVFLVEYGEVQGAVNNFRWNMSPIAAFAQTAEIGGSGLALPREHDEFLRAKAPPVRIDRFNMSSVSSAT